MKSIPDQIEARSATVVVPAAHAGASMKEYFLYCFESRDVVECEAFFAPDDRGAIETASGRRAGRAAKLWAGSRKICTFEEAPERLRPFLLTSQAAN